MLALLLSGCVQGRAYWKKADGSEWDADSTAQFKQDDYECQKDAKTYTDPNNIDFGYSLRHWYRNCLESKGYRVIEDPKEFYPKDNRKTNPLFGSESKEIIKNPKQIYWKKSDGTQWDAASLEQLKQDSYECQKDTTRSFVNCMISKGYEIIENPKYIMKGNEKIKNPDYIAK
jgi:hypothetical protein